MSEITVSLVLLTYNRKEAVDESLMANLHSAGYPIKELIHVDNGSDRGFAEWFREKYDPTVQIINRENLGVAKGYNRGLALATSSHIVITGCDRIMPKNWLEQWVDAYIAIANTGVISMYTEIWESRMKGPEQVINNVLIREAEACEARFHSREFLLGAGYLREDFGLYGYEDCEWLDRASTYAYQKGLINYILPALGCAHHIPDGRIKGSEYFEMKTKENDDPRKPRLVKWCHNQGSPYYNPFYQIEPNLLDQIQEDDV